jgi:DNA end-binding protein Ku
MAPRANWKGYLKLSLVSCPVALYPATSEREKVSFHQINSKTGNRVRMVRVDAETGDPVDWDDIVKGYEYSKGSYIEVTKEELEAISLESTRTIEIDEFVPKQEIDDLYNVRPYYLAPDGKTGVEAFAVIRDVIEAMDQVAIGRVVLTSREHIIALEPRGKGIMGTLLRYPYEVRDEADYFEDIPHIRVGKDELDLAKHIVKSKAGHFKPDKFEDRYEEAVRELLKRKQAGERIEQPKEPPSAKIINLMDALRASVHGADGKKPAARSTSRRKRGSSGARKSTRTFGKRKKAS